MPEYSRHATSTASAGLGFLIVALLLVLSGCNGDDDSNPAPPPDEVTDFCPVDPLKTEEGLCGCGIADTDSDGDGDPDCTDVCPDLPDTLMCGSDTQVVAAGETLVIELDGARLTIPADTLDVGMRVSLAEMDPDLLDTPPNSTGESLITPVYELAFSDAQPANGKLIFTFDIPSSITTGFYARVKIEGGLGTEGQSDSDWLIVPGEYDAQQSQLTIELGATATRFLVTGISTDAVAPSIGAGVLTNAVKDPAPMVTQSFAATALESLFPTPEWASHGWVVFCSPYSFAAFGLTSCDPSSPDFEPMMNDIGSKLYASDKILTALGFSKGEMSRISASAIERMRNIPYVIYDPDNRSIVSVSTTGILSYFQAWVDPDKTDTLLGVYYPGPFGHMSIDRSASDETVIHELMHAVQYGEIRNAWGNNWIIEGLAAATQVVAPSSNAPSGEGFRYFGVWRDWQFPLSNDDNTNEYKTSEFWLSVDGTLYLLPDFYNNLGGKGELFDYSAYLTVDDAMTESGLPSLRDGYTNLISSRDIDPGYTYCKEDPVLDCSDGVCNLSMYTAPFSAQCFDIFDIEDQLCPDVADPPDIEVTLVTDSEQFPLAAIKLMLNGVISDANTPVPFVGGRLWAINTAYTDNRSPTEATLKFEAECNSYVVQLERQKIFAGAVANSSPPGGGGNNALSPGLDGSADTYTSYEDLILDSFITSYERLRKPDQFIDTVVAPLGLNAWSASPSVSAAHRCDGIIFACSDTTTVSTATASATVTTDTDNDATSMTTVGSHALSATIGNKGAYAYANGYNVYTYILAGESVELTLTWGCDMSFVSVKLLDPETRHPETLYRVGNHIDPIRNNWECDAKVWTLPPDKLLQIELRTNFDEYFSDAGSPETFQNNGGAFEIKLQAIPPADE
jgi:hypothetical protein